MLWPNASSPISAASNMHFGRADQPRAYRRSAGCAVERRRLGARHSGQTSECLQRRDRTGRAAPWCGYPAAGRFRDQRGLDAGRRERDRGGQPGRAAADHRDFDRLAFAMQSFLADRAHADDDLIPPAVPMR